MTNEKINLETYVDEAKKYLDTETQQMFKGWMENLMLKKYADVIHKFPDPRIYVGIAEVLKRVATAQTAAQFLTGQLGRRYASLADYLSEVEQAALNDVTKKFPEIKSQIVEVYKSI